MIIKRCPLLFHNVLSSKVTDEELAFADIAIDLRNAVIRNGMYATGPVIYQVKKESDKLGKYRFYVSVNTSVTLEENDQFAFDSELKFEDGLVIRHADLEEDLEESYEILRECAKEYNLTLVEPFYNIYLDVYGGGVIDIYAPIEVSAHDQFK